MAKQLTYSGLERREQLLRFVQARNRVTIEQVCAEFDISPATARRDLQALADDGKIRRFHGGAIAAKTAPPEPPFLERSSEQAEEKRRIGQAAAGLVRDGESVLLSSGTTVLEVARHLRDRRNLTVVTNSLLVMNMLVDVPHITLIALGGMLRSSEQSFIGHLSELALNELRVNKVIMGIRAIDLESGLTNDYLPETQTDRKILSIGREIILVADHTKCERTSSVFLAPLTVVNTFVTDSKAPPAFLEALRELGIQVLAV
ncbi:MAG: DeoR/GlpR family DNA-binding transcription regulator [Chloroflexota bacterium]|nr:MAG: DeoR/GlpR transcriptional regulator [Chloroflexota bacterium]